MVSASSSIFAVQQPEHGIRRDIVEFLVVGGATLLLIPCAWLFQKVSGFSESEYLVSMMAFYAAHVINDPHFGVTYVLFYKRLGPRAWGSEFDSLQRLRYIFAGFVAPALMIGWIGWALRGGSPERMGTLIQLMFFLVSWHYVKQGFGVLTVLSLRRGIRFTPSERRWILTHCFSGWAYAWSSPSGPSYQVQESGIVYWTLSIPPLLEQVTQAVFFASAIGVIGVVLRKWRRERVLPPLVPLVGFFITVWLWSVYSNFDPLIAYFIPALHSIQYLYFVWLLRRNQACAEVDDSFGGAGFQRIGWRLITLAATALAIGWLAFRGMPQFFDSVFVLNDPDLRGGLGPTPYLAAIGTFVNIHHYFMDNVIWRRQNPESRFLMSDTATK